MTKGSSMLLPESRLYLHKTDSMKKIGIYILLLLSVILSGCSQDLGNYEYTELEDPGITGIEELSVLMFSHMRIEPRFSEDFDRAKYSFEWKVLEISGTQEPVIIGNSAVLDYDVTLGPGTYQLFFTVTDSESQIYWQKEAVLTVSSSTSEGWMVLCSDDGRARLDFISDVTGETIRDILASGDMPVLHGPRKIQWLSDKTDASSPYYLLTDEGATRLGKDDFEWKPEYDFSYEAAVQEKLLPHSIVSAGFGKVTVSQGKAYYCEVMGFDGLYGSAVNKNFRVSEYVGANVLATQVYAAVYLLYDIDSKRLMAFCPLLATNDLGAQETLMDMDSFADIADGMNPGNGVLGNSFDVWPEGYDCMYMENTRYDPGNARMGMTYVMLTDGSKCLLYGIQLGDLLCYADCTYVMGKGGFAELTGCKDILKEGNLFAFSSLKNYMYYASGSNVYRVDLSGSPVREELQFSLDGEKITCLKFNLYQNEENHHRSYDLIVASDRDGEGILRVYDGMTHDGDFRDVTPAVYDGFAEIRDVTYKERIY